MTERVRISELHTFRGKFPVVDTFEHVDTELLYEGDSKPFHLTLAIAEIGRTSVNGLLYDEELVSRIEEQLKQGAGGIRGHIPDGQEDSAYPYDEVNWIGAQREGNLLWAKAYVPPGPNREDIRRKMATGGKVGTSIYGKAVKELAAVAGSSRAWRAKSFELESLDLAPAKRASLKMGGEFAITREIEEGNHPMPTDDNTSGGSNTTPVREISSINDVPQAIREQIIKQAQIEADASRVRELESQVNEMRQYASIIAEIRTTLGKDTDIVSTFNEYHEQMTKLAEMLGIPYTNITLRVEEMHEQVAEMAKRDFESAVSAQVAELTNWRTNSEAASKKVDTFRKSMRRAVISELGAERSPEKIAEVSKKLWDEEYGVMSQSLIAELGGPAAVIGGKKPEPTGKVTVSDEELTELGSRYLPNKGK